LSSSVSMRSAGVAYFAKHGSSVATHSQNATLGTILATAE
jgi:hypothetical protein